MKKIIFTIFLAISSVGTCSSVNADDSTDVFKALDTLMKLNRDSDDRFWDSDKCYRVYTNARERCQYSAEDCAKVARFHSTLDWEIHCDDTVKKDDKKANAYALQACNQGSALGCYLYARQKENGAGFWWKSIGDAKTYYKKSCDMGYTEACKAHLISTPSETRRF